MKNCFSVFLLLLAYFFSHAQDTNTQTIAIDDIKKMMSKGEQPCIKTDIYQARKAEVEKAWNKATRKSTKAKPELVNNEWTLSGAVLKEVSAQPLNVYSIINQYPQHIELNAFFEKENVFLSKETAETEYLAARMFVRNFAISQYRSAVTLEIKNEEAKVKKLEKGAGKLNKVNDKLRKNINSEKRKIEKEKQNIHTSEDDQQRVHNQVQSLKTELQNVKSSGASEAIVKDAEKRLKTAEKELAGLRKAEDKMHKTVEKTEAVIRNFERSISDNDQSILLQNNEITAQRELVHQLKKKLETIK